MLFAGVYDFVIPTLKKGWLFIKAMISFRIESGLVSDRLRWEVGDDLRRMADIECPGLRHKNAAEIMDLLRQDLPMLNEARHHVVEKR